MKGIDDGRSQRRDILLSARIQVENDFRGPKSSYIDSIVQTTLLVADLPITLNELAVRTCEDGIPTVNDIELANSLNRLVTEGSVIIYNQDSEATYELSELARTECTRIRKNSRENLSKVVHTLFKNVVGTETNYEAPFEEALCVIFSRLGGRYAKALTGEEDTDILTESLIEEALEIVRPKYKRIDQNLLREGIRSFFADRKDSGFSQIKWSLAHRYYVAKVLGLDPTGGLLSREQFYEVIFYLDTNLIIDILTPDSKLQRNFQYLCRVFAKLSIQLKVAEETLVELNRVLNRWREELENDNTGSLPGWVVQGYKQFRKDKPDDAVNYDIVFAPLSNSIEHLNQLYPVELVEDDWFSQSRGSHEVSQLAPRIVFLETGRKSKEAAVHDALLLLWIQHCRQVQSRRVWFLTRNNSLTRVQAETDGNGPRQAVTLDALLQWISPATLQDDRASSAQMFAYVIRTLFRYEVFFSLEVIERFVELADQTGTLPYPQVEETIRFFAAVAPNSDLANPDDRTELLDTLITYIKKATKRIPGELLYLEKKVEKLSDELEHIREELRQSEGSKTMFLALIAILGLAFAFSIVALLLL